MKFTSEMVFRGHPDKVCDQIAGAILDALLYNDVNSKAGIEVLGAKKKLHITGEVTTKATVDYAEIAKRVLKDVGYPDMPIEVDVSEQSADIAQGLDDDGAGDNGIMFGYATREDESGVQIPERIMREFVRMYDSLRQVDTRLKSDGKIEIVADVDGLTHKTRAIEKIVVCYQNTETLRGRAETDAILKNMLIQLCKTFGFTPKEIVFNPTGKFKVGGFKADSGLTGRKIVVDSYCGYSRVGGGNMNGKDPSKADVYGAYFAREIAQYVVARGIVNWCEVQVSYAIGTKFPLSISALTDLGYLTEFDMGAFLTLGSKSDVIRRCDMFNPNYEAKAWLGHHMLTERRF